MGKEYIRDITVLGSVPNLGPVILSDDLEGLFKWTGSGTGAETVEKSTTVAYNGSASLHLQTVVAGSAEDDIATAGRLVFARPGKRYRFECLFQILSLITTKYVSFRLYIYDGTNTYYIDFRYDAVNYKWQYLTAAASFSDVPGGSQRFYPAAWNRFAIEFDQVSNKLGKFICNSLDLDLSALSYYYGAIAGAEYARVEFENQTAGASPCEAFFEDVLIMEI